MKKFKVVIVRRMMNFLMLLMIMRVRAHGEVDLLGRARIKILVARIDLAKIFYEKKVLCFFFLKCFLIFLVWRICFVMFLFLFYTLYIENYNYN